MKATAAVAEGAEGVAAEEAEKELVQSRWALAWKRPHRRRRTQSPTSSVAKRQ
jgi:hypothetical protein